jgi:adenosine deaminase
MDFKSLFQEGFYMITNTLLPKAELHVHLEGAIPPITLRKLAARNKIRLPDKLFSSEKTYAWSNFQDFLTNYDLVASAVRTPLDYHDITYDYLSESAKEGVIYSELTVSPDHARANGIPYNDMLHATQEGIINAKKDFGIESKIIMTGVRHFGIDSVKNVAKEVTKNLTNYVVGFGLAGDEINYRPKLFENAFKIAAEAGLGCTPHSGEMAGPDSIEEALSIMTFPRIGHGIRAEEDNKLLQKIIDHKITLEVCPSSNIALGVRSSYGAHPLKKLIDAGVKVTLNSDDPYFFGSTIGNEYEIARRIFKLTTQELIHITKTAIENSFADSKTKKQLINKIHEWQKNNIYRKHYTELAIA